MAKRYGSLDREAILDAALDLLDERGLEGFTLRSLAERLGYSTMATYRHFADKDEIIETLADRLLDEIRVEDVTVEADPDELIMDYVLRAREILLSHPALVPVIAARPMARTAGTDDIVRLFAVFGAAGFPPAMIPRSVLAIVSTTIGLILQEQQRALYDKRQEETYQQARLELFAELMDRPDAPAEAGDLVQLMLSGEWPALLFEQTMRDCYAGLKRRAGIADHDDD